MVRAAIHPLRGGQDSRTFFGPKAEGDWLSQNMDRLTVVGRPLSKFVESVKGVYMERRRMTKKKKKKKRREKERRDLMRMYICNDLQLNEKTSPITHSFPSFYLPSPSSLFGLMIRLNLRRHGGSEVDPESCPGCV